MPKAAKARTKISATGKSRELRGFTLLELLVVLSILALVAGIAILPSIHGVSGADVRSAARSLSTGLRLARSQAMASNEESLFTLNVEQGWFALDDGEKTDLTDGLKFAYVTARSEMLDESTARIRFFPDGSSSGGQIKIVSGARQTIVEVEWLTGKITVTE